MKPVKIAFVGECMIEMREDPQHGLRKSYSGDTLNTAVYFNREMQSFTVSADFVTATGIDTFSKDMLAFWKQEGLGCDNILQLSDKHPGLYFIQADKEGERSFTYWRNDSAARYLLSSAGSEDLLISLARYDVVYLSGITLAILREHELEKLFTALEVLKSNKGKIYFDSNFRPALWPDTAQAQHLYDRILHLADIAFLSLEDMQLLYNRHTPEQVLQLCLPFGIPELVIKCGDEACRIWHEEDVLVIPAEKVEEVVDTTAAGDSFNAAYLATRLQGRTPEISARAGHRLAAQVIQFHGVFEHSS